MIEKLTEALKALGDLGASTLLWAAASIVLAIPLTAFLHWLVADVWFEASVQQVFAELSLNKTGLYLIVFVFVLAGIYLTRFVASALTKWLLAQKEG